jgi:hypothetical protein
MTFLGFGIKSYDKQRVRQRVYVCKGCHHHNYVDLTGHNEFKALNGW